jgi:hypothetical protein
MAHKWPWAGRLRNWLLMLFITSTYPIATVIGFGWLLALMGLAQCNRRKGRAALGYIVVFALMQIYLLPWGSLFSEAAAD